MVQVEMEMEMEMVVMDEFGGEDEEGRILG